MPIRLTTAPMTSLQFGVDCRSPEVASVAVSGELDLVTLPALRERLLGLIADGWRSIVVDLADVCFCDSSGLGVFVGAHRRLCAVDGDLELIHTRPSIRHLFEVSGLDQVLHVS